MAMEATCDGCGAKAPAVGRSDGTFVRPRGWYWQTDKFRVVLACSPTCCAKVAKELGISDELIDTDFEPRARDTF